MIHRYAVSRKFRSPQKGSSFPATRPNPPPLPVLVLHGIRQRSGAGAVEQRSKMSVAPKAGCEIIAVSLPERVDPGVCRLSRNRIETPAVKLPLATMPTSCRARR
jgi:hypothetical protein